MRQKTPGQKGSRTGGQDRTGQDGLIAADLGDTDGNVVDGAFGGGLQQAASSARDSGKSKSVETEWFQTIYDNEKQAMKNKTRETTGSRQVIYTSRRRLVLERSRQKF
jgi:hypothetical protein